MAIASLVFGILSLVGTCVALVPVISVLNYCLNLPMAVLGTVFGIAHLIRAREMTEDRQKGLAITGLVLSVLALLIAIVRIILSLVFGLGIF